MNEQQIQIRATDQDLKGVYSNVVLIGHSQEEFTLDFLNVIGKAGILSSRVIVTPGHFKRIIQAFSENLKAYEQKFGTVMPTEAPKQDFGFKA
ncbi:MAG: DUF3467 domain-containing protein [Patescibacteria group bacterium]|nr:DUF3467 domain-containing protein [Patescibacteria group bacterium]